MIWAIIFALTLVALILLVQPFFRQQTDTQTLDDEDYLIAQLDDIERDRVAGLLSEKEAAAATAEARRRLLDQTRAVREKSSPGAAQAARMASVVVVAAAPVAAVAIYMALGNPMLAPAEGTGPRAAAPPLSQPGPQPSGESATAPSVAESIERLAARLEENPDDLNGWIMLADSYAATDQFGKAAEAFARAVALAPERAFLHAALGESIAMANGGEVNDEALAAFDRALELDPAEPRARFYKALATYQSGDPQAALDALAAIANDAPPGAPWLGIVGDQIEVIAGELDRPLEDLALTDAARAALAGGATPEAIEARLAAGGAPYTDWLALIDAYASAGDGEKAEGALARARERYQAAPFVLQELDAAARRLGLEAGSEAAPRRGPSEEQMAAAADMSDAEREAMIEGMVEGLAARLEAEPGDFEGWMMLGRSYGVLGQPAASAGAFARAVELQPESMPARIAHAQALLSKLDAEGAPIGAETEEALKAIEQRNPEEPFALYFLGVAAQQDGDEESAREYWEKLLAQLPEDSEDAARVREMVEGL